MLEALLEIFAEPLIALILWPIMITLATPIILLRALLLKMQHEQHFGYAVSDGYQWVTDLWLHFLT